MAESPERTQAVLGPQDLIPTSAAFQKSEVLSPSTPAPPPFLLPTSWPTIFYLSLQPYAKDNTPSVPLSSLEAFLVGLHSNKVTQQGLFLVPFCSALLRALCLLQLLSLPPRLKQFLSSFLSPHTVSSGQLQQAPLIGT